MPEYKFLTQLNLSHEDRLHPPAVIGKLKTVHEWASAAIDAVKDNGDFLAALKELSPWAEAAFSAAKDTLAPVKFVVKVFEELTKIQEPEELARLACTLAYQSAAEKAIAKFGPALRSPVVGPKFDDATDEVDFSNFTLNQLVTHGFVVQADRILRYYLPLGGFSETQISQIIGEIHEELPGELNILISHGKSKEKFDPLFRWLTLPADGRLSRAALRRHADYVSWVFNEAPVFQCEPYALAHVCIEAECSKLIHRDLREPGKLNHPRPNPFAEGDLNGGRHSLLETVMGYILDPAFRDAIVIQGSAGCGKSTFTVRLADHLRREGFRPIRIRLRDVTLGREFYSQMGDALTYQDDAYLARHERFTVGAEPIQNGAIFQEELRYVAGTVALCPYVLILDGWDEISVAVSEGFRQRVKELLLRIRSELFRSGRPIVRVILTGRPSDAIDDCSEFFRDETPVLTIRTLNPDQLPWYADKLRRATESKPLSFEGMSAWKFPDDNTITPIFKRYRSEFRGNTQPVEQEPDEARTGIGAVLGYPLLLHVTFRLLAEPNIDRKELVESPAALLRKLTDYATSIADRPSDGERGAKIQPRISGTDLRVLLRRTAAQMTILGQESISKAELEKRLKTDDLVRLVKDVAKDNLISALLVSFYFKGGNAALGCEFTHKAFREYLFAEEVVETVKAFGREMPDGLPERSPSLYWKDFDSADPRRRASIDLASLLGPQWLTPEVVRYVGSLLEWEVRRSFSTHRRLEATGETSAITHSEWKRIVTLLADLWDWWADAVHVRPQPKEDEYTGQIQWDRSLAEKLVPKCRPLIPSGSAGNLPEPIRTITLDAHIGDGLFRLCSWVYWHWNKHSSYGTEGDSRRYQSLNQGRPRFRPTGINSAFFGVLCKRISAAGWRPDGEFPNKIFGKGLNLDATDLSGLSFARADLEDTSFMGATISNCGFQSANLVGCDFSNGMVIDSSFRFANLTDARLSSARCLANRFNGAILKRVSFSKDWINAEWYGGPERGHLRVPDNDFTDAVGLDNSDQPIVASRAITKRRGKRN